MIEKILKMADEVLNKGSLTSRHSKYQMRYFIVNSEPTHQGRLWQCLKEIDARKENLLQLQNEKLDFEDRVELEQINIQILQRDIEKESDELEDKKKKINLRRAQRSFEALKKTGSKIYGTTTNNLGQIFPGGINLNKRKNSILHPAAIKIKSVMKA